jgi:iron(III) transport system permease protein
MLLSTLVSWVVLRTDAGILRRLDMLAFMPLAMPSVLIALALYLASLGTPLQGTIWIIAIGHVIRYLPFGTRTMHAGFMQVHRELEEAGAMSGAGPFAVLRRILLPLLGAALVNGWLWVASHSMRDLTFPLMLVSAHNYVIGTLLWEYWYQGALPEASAVAVVLVLTLLFLALPIRLYSTAAAAAART